MSLLSSLIVVSFVVFASVSLAEKASPQLALAAERSDDHEKAIAIFTQLADAGDSKAMMHIGNKFYQGDGVPVNYDKSLDWWLRALNSNDGDAPGNIGVLFRDGKGVSENRKIAYTLFLLTHMVGLGTESTQIRVNRLLRKEMSELSMADKREALCYTLDYVFAYVHAKGKLNEPPKETLPSSGKIRIKDSNWWLESERETLKFECIAPWA